MRFSIERLKKFGKMKLPSWGGYWSWDDEKQTIMMHCKQSDVDKGQKSPLDIRETQRVEYTVSNILSDKWQVADETNCPLLGGVARMDAETAESYIKRGLFLKKISETEWTFDNKVGEQ